MTTFAAIILFYMGAFGCSWFEAHAVDCADEERWQRIKHGEEK